MSRPILIDGGFISSQAKYSLGFARTSDGMRTGIVFGILFRLLSLNRYLHSRQFIFAWDSKESLRKEIYPEYKANRRKKMSPEEWEEFKEFKEQVLVFRKDILSRLGFKNSFIKKGYEADDIIASIVKQGFPCFVFSADSDLFQLLGPSCSQVIPVKGRERFRLFSASDFTEKYGIHPKLWWKVKALTGCSSDNVKGLKGIGEVSAIRYLNNDLSSGQKYVMIRDNVDIIKKNGVLVRLPFEGCGKFKIKEDQLDYDAFIDLCKEYEIASFLEGQYQVWWSSFFGTAKKNIRSRLNVKRKSKGVLV